MNEQQFCYWLNGFAELNQQPPTPEQWKSIREHLATVFKKVTPAINPILSPVYKPNVPDLSKDGHYLNKSIC